MMVYVTEEFDTTQKKLKNARKQLRKLYTLLDSNNLGILGVTGADATIYNEFSHEKYRIYSK